MNKYLEKIAFLGFSKKEKMESEVRRHFIARNNHFADTVNQHMSKWNDGFKGDAKKDWDGYVSHLEKSYKSHKPLYDDFKGEYDKHAAKMKELGYTPAHASHHEEMEHYVNSMVQGYRSYKP